MIQATENNLLISVATKYIKNISNIMKVAAIENNSSVDPADIVQIVGEVVSIPERITNDVRGYDGFSTKDIRVGDTAIFRFDVIYSFRNISATEREFKNRIWWDGKEYWNCDIQKVFGVIRNGEILMVNGYVMVADFETPRIILSQSYAKSRGAANSKVLYIGNPKIGQKHLQVEKDDNVFFNQNLAAKYQINGKYFRIIQQSALLGVEK